MIFIQAEEKTKNKRRKSSRMAPLSFPTAEHLQNPHRVHTVLVWSRRKNSTSTTCSSSLASIHQSCWFKDSRHSIVNSRIRRFASSKFEIPIALCSYVQAEESGVDNGFKRLTGLALKWLTGTNLLLPWLYSFLLLLKLLSPRVVRSSFRALEIVNQELAWEFQDWPWRIFIVFLLCGEKASIEWCRLKLNLLELLMSKL